jgi:hypothetical protein
MLIGGNDCPDEHGCDDGDTAAKDDWIDDSLAFGNRVDHDYSLKRFFLIGQDTKI